MKIGFKHISIGIVIAICFALYYPDQSQAVVAILTLGIVLYQLQGAKEELQATQKRNEHLLNQLEQQSEIATITGQLHSYFEIRRLSVNERGHETDTKDSKQARDEIPKLMERLKELSKKKASA